jgi:hypothetical protein
MGIFTKLMLGRKVSQLADLIVAARPARIEFASEEQFLEMLGLRREAVRIDSRQHRRMPGAGTGIR